MKKVVFITMLAVSCFMMTSDTKAQVNVRINIGSQPEWAPVGYNTARYYYIPDIDVYYDVPAREFVYFNNKHWMRSASLPFAYRHFNLYKVHKVPLYNRDAYLNHDFDRRKYAQFRGRFDQQSLHDSRSRIVYNNKDNRHDDNWNKNNGRNVKRNDRHYDHKGK